MKMLKIQAMNFVDSVEVLLTKPDTTINGWNKEEVNDFSKALDSYNLLQHPN